MISMKIVLDTEKIKNSDYTETQIWNMIHEIMINDKISIKNVGEYESKNMGNFAMVIEDLVYKENWFRPIVKTWTWNINGKVENLLEIF